MDLKLQQRLKIIYIYKLLLNTDEDHPIDSIYIMNELKKVGISCARKALYFDMEALMEIFPEIEKERSTRNRYYISKREFDDAEVKALIDIVLSSYFVSQKQSDKLIDKIAKLSGKTREDYKIKNEYIQKTDNQYLLSWMGLIIDAINTNSAISFYYYDIDPSGQKIYHHNKELYKCLPVELKYSNGKYYMLAYKKDTKGIRTFRLDKLDNIKWLDEEIEIIKDDIEEEMLYFDMYPGKSQKVTLICHRSIIDQVLEKFKKNRYENNEYEIIEDNKYKIKIEAPLVPPFFAWCATYKDKLTIFEPKIARDEYKKFLKDSLEMLDKY